MVSDNASKVFYDQFINSLKNESPITEEAKQWAEKYATFDKKALDVLRVADYSEDQVKRPCRI